ncbi:beta-ketoacyl synthase N-terminal-like domain-containing protein [Micromonospora sp. NPDC126480]|uniref:type I polyketide synthase n=1 Tax=Micromonospora sp. NPDC126480 TaxID=3155312 RepID=UPI0033215839
MRDDTGFVAEQPGPRPTPPAAELSGLEIAVVGMAIRAPGADDLDAYAELVRTGTSAVRRFTAAELAAAGVPADEAAHPDHVAAGGVLADAECFDAALFGYSPRDASILDPQQRVFLECAWHALEHAGHAGSGGERLVGVYAAASMSSYLLRHLLPNPAVTADVSVDELVLANDKDTLAARVAYHLDLRGPAVSVQTACSSSLVAIHLAGQALLARDCDLALAGGVSVRLPQTAGYRYVPGGVLAPDGVCRPFDEAAAGTVGGNGVGVVVLRRLVDALADGDTVHAVIRGSAVTSDGAARVGFTAPGVAGQVAVVRGAHEAAEVAPATIGYVEAHGTGTPLGDPIEVAALTEAFRAGAPQGTGWCALGSVKAVIGHLDVAAGVAGFIRAVLAVRDGWIPPNPHLGTPSPALELARSPFRLPVRPELWPDDRHPRRAGVSSFGMGGTNAHIVIEQPPAATGRTPAARPHEALLLSAASASALDAHRQRLADFLAARPGLALGDVAYTLHTGRRALAHRMAVVCADPADAAGALAAEAPAARDTVTGGAPEVVFLFPGQGAQHAGMGAGLYRHEPRFRSEFDRCAELLRPHLDSDPRTLLGFDRPADEAGGGRHLLTQTRYAQPLLFCVEYALARWWRARGVSARTMLGHSVGAYVAACLAGTMRLADALAAVAARGRLMQGLPAGAMLSVTLPADDARDLADLVARRQGLVGQLALAAANAPDLSVLSGPVRAVDALAAELAARSIPHRRLRTSHAFHSPMMDPILDEFGEVMSGFTLRPPDLPFISDLTGEPITPAEATDPDYWVRHLREPVRFSDGLRTVLATGHQVLLEVGPGTVLTTLARRQDLASGGHVAVNSLPHPDSATPETAAILAAVGRCWTAGVPVAPVDAADGARRRVPLPGYPFARQRHWVVAPAGDGGTVVAPAADGAERGAAPGWLTSPQTDAPAAAEPDHAGGDGYPEEELVAAVWRQMLGVDAVGRHDNFFELGGHSLLATQVLARIRQATGVDLPTGVIFTCPTVGELAAEVRRLAAAPEEDDEDLAALLAELGEFSPEAQAAELELIRKARGEHPA